MSAPQAQPAPDARRLALLLDEREIIEVTHRYCAALDQRQWADLARCFTFDAVASYGSIRGDHRGLAAIEQVCRRSLEPLDASQHLVANHLIDIHGDTATSRCYVRAQHTRRGLPGGENFMVAGVYSDQWRRTGEGWRITRRRLEVTWTEGNPSVLRWPARHRPEPQRGDQREPPAGGGGEATR